ncbi:general secretion pathway protein L [Shimia isoporae]|uniref:General secretion pathway protein L n=2 Tax=Shimia isoporae TaxID=647720 RepID=A0A4R1N174_9RHOB|nr:general secretion pathway protein L [Shimia isoporae]
MTLTGVTPTKAGPEGTTLVPGELVPVLPLDLPVSLRGSTREQVARRQLEDSASLDPNTAEIRPFALSGNDKNWTRALVADQKLIIDWVAAAPSDCKAVLPDYVALPAASGLWSFRYDEAEERLLARLGLDDGFTTEISLAPLLLERALSEGPSPDAILWEGPELETVSALFDTAGLPRVQNSQDAGAKILGHGELALDLRKDPFATRAHLRQAVLPWRWPVIIGLIAVGIWATAQTVAVDALRQERDIVTARTMDVVRAQFVPSGPVLDVRTQVSRVISEARAEALLSDDGLSPLALFGETVDLISAPGVTPERVEYRENDGLRLVLEVADFATGEALVSALGDLNLSVDVVRSEAGGERSGVLLELILETAND